MPKRRGLRGMQLLQRILHTYARARTHTHTTATGATSTEASAAIATTSIGNHFRIYRGTKEPYCAHYNSRLFTK